MCGGVCGEGGRRGRGAGLAAWVGPRVGPGLGGAARGGEGGVGRCVWGVLAVLAGDRRSPAKVGKREKAGGVESEGPVFSEQPGLPPGPENRCPSGSEIGPC